VAEVEHLMAPRTHYVGTLKGRDPARPDGTAWVPFGGTGPTGDIGPIGPTGPTGPTGPIGVHAGTAEVWVNNNAPNPIANPAVELWYDLDEQRGDFLNEIPPNGAAGAPLTMTSDTHGDTDWTLPFLPLTGPSTVNSITTRNLTVTSLAAPAWEGDVMMVDGLSAEAIYDAGYEQHLAWEQLDVDTLLVYNWHSDLTIGPCKAWRNRYMVLVNLAMGCNPEPSQEVWHDVAQLPPGWAPLGELWDARPSVDVNSDGPTCEDRITATGMIQLRVKALNSPDPQPLTTRYCIYFCFPRAGV
jgi:hypothetical protein